MPKGRTSPNPEGRIHSELRAFGKSGDREVIRHSDRLMNSET